MKENVLIIVGITLFCLLTIIFVGLRPEHILIVVFVSVLFFAGQKTRKFIVGFIPFVLFAVSYDWMRVYPNYKVNPIDIEGLYNLEKSLFGITNQGMRLIPSEYFALHHHSVVDFLSGIFYLGWVPVPVIFGIYLYLINRKDVFLRFSMVFLFVNLIGFLVYYIHPAAPPWYAMNFGFEPVLSTSGNIAGLSRFDTIVGFPLFDFIYGRNANVFAAFPSLHSAYLVIALFYAFKNKCRWNILVTIAVFMCGIWFTAVYTAHHYIIDVFSGIFCALLGIFLFEYVLMNRFCFKVFFNKYLNYIQ